MLHCKRPIISKSSSQVVPDGLLSVKFPSVLPGQPVSELLWRCAWQAWNGDVLPGGSFNRRGRLRALPAEHLLVEGLTAERELIQQLAKLLYRQALTSRQLADLSGAPEALAERFFATAECAGLLE